MYLVVGCSNCKGIKIVEKDSKTTLCNRCRKNIDIDKVRVFYRTEVLDEAKKARSVLLSLDRPKKLSRKDILDNISNIKDTGFSSPTDISKRQKNRKGTKKSNKEIILDYLKGSQNPTVSGLNRYAEKNNIDQERAKQILDKLCREGKAIKVKDNKIRLL